MGVEWSPDYRADKPEPVRMDEVIPRPKVDPQNHGEDPAMRSAWRHPFKVAVIDAAHIERQRAFSLRTFGPPSPERQQGVLDHLRKELIEVEADPTDLSEWVDVIILGFDGAYRAGHEPQAIIDAIVAKQTKNERRTWPDWRTADPGRAIEHDRTVGDPDV